MREKRTPPPELLSRQQREQRPDGRDRNKQLNRDSTTPLVEDGPQGRPRHVRYGPGQPDTHSLAAGVARLQELGKDHRVYLVRRADSSRIRYQGKCELHYLLAKMPWDRITAGRLVPGVTLYAVRGVIDGQDTLITVDAVGLDWRGG